LWSDLRLTGIAWQVLAAAAEENQIVLRFCSTVLDEAKAKFVELADTEVQHLMGKTQKYLPDSGLLTPVLGALKAEAAGFGDYLPDRILDGLKAEILPYPEDITHEEMTARALRRIPPFNQNGGGYRDSLIWLAALAEAKGLKTELVVVSADKAFIDPKTSKRHEKGGRPELHPALVAEAAERGVTAHLSETLSYLITDYLYPSDGGERVDLTTLAASKAQEQIVTFLEEHLAEPEVTASLDIQAMGLPSSVTDFKVDYVENVQDVTLTKLQEIDGGQVVHSFTAKCDIELDVSVYEGTAEAYEWPIQERYGHGDVGALVNKNAEVSGLITLSPFGLAVDAEATEWSAEPEDYDDSWDEPCGCSPHPHTPRAPTVISVRRPGPRMR
jgi:hypothetical protein